MPIRESERARYPKDWPAISLRIRERAGQRCEWPGCGAPNGVEIKRLEANPERWVTADAFVSLLLDADRMGKAEALALAWRAPVRVVLTVAHLDHMPEHCADDNLRALCQLHHLRLDARHHARNARDTRDRKRGQTRLF